MANDKNKPSDDEILERAMILQYEADAQREAMDDREDRIKAANEVGVSREHLLAAERELYEEREKQNWEDKQLKRLLINIGLLTAFIGVVISYFFIPEYKADSPWVESFETTGKGWSFVASPGTRGKGGLIPELGDDRGVGFILVERFDAQKAKNGRYFANLRLNSSIDLKGYSNMRVRIKGHGLLNTIRLYLRDGSKRWRSPAMTITSEWTEHAIDLSDFDCQKKKKKSWKGVSCSALDDVDRVQFKVGYFMNNPDDHGVVYIDDLVFVP